MEVRVRIHSRARESIHHWRARMRRRPGGRELDTAFLRTMIEELARSGGRPPGAQFVFQMNPQVGVWEFQSRDTWVVFTRELKGGW